MGHVLQVDTASGSVGVLKDWGSNAAEVWVYADVALSAAALTNLLTNPSSFTKFDFYELSSHTSQDSGAEFYVDTGPIVKWAAYNTSGDPASTPTTPSPVLASMQFYRVKIHIVAGTPATQQVWIDGNSLGAITAGNMADIRTFALFNPGLAAGYLYFDNVKVGTTDGAGDIFSDDFEGGSLASWTTVDAGCTIITDPGISAAGSAGNGRVLVAWDDGPLEPTPTWTVLDQGGDFPVGFVSGYDLTTGRQSLISQTDTGTATVYINDRDGLFDDRNVSSPYQGKLSGRQILLQLYDPVRGVWEEEFRGLIDDYNYDIDGSAVGADGKPINANIQLECVDVFDYLAGYGLTPGLDGVTPPVGSEDTIYYAETAGSVQDRIIEVMADVGIDTSMYVAASGNVKAQEAKYDPDEPALTVLRDCADAELPFIGLHYCDRHGRYAWRGRYSRFYPDDVAAEPGSEWDFHRWAVGDGPAILSDPTRAQIRELSYSRSRQNIINAAIAYPQGIEAADMPGQVYANAPSITAYGKHTPPGPMSDLLTKSGTVTLNDANTETALYAELLVKNQKDPRVTLTACQLKSINPSDSRASATWALITQCDISDIVNVAVGYPGGTGFAGSSPEDDYYVEGRHMTVRPANTGYDYVELDLEVSAAVWSMDTNGVFPNPFA